MGIGVRDDAVYIAVVRSIRLSRESCSTVFLDRMGHLSAPRRVPGKKRNAARELACDEDARETEKGREREGSTARGNSEQRK